MVSAIVYDFPFIAETDHSATFHILSRNAKYSFIIGLKVTADLRDSGRLKKSFSGLLNKSQEVVSSSSATDGSTFSVVVNSALFPVNFSYQIG